MDIIRFKESFDPYGNRAILVKETPIPEMVPGYPEGPAYDFFFVDLGGFFKGRENGDLMKLDKSGLQALYKHIEGRKDRIFIWYYLKDLSNVDSF